MNHLLSLTVLLGTAFNSIPERFPIDKATLNADSELIQGNWVIAGMEVKGEFSSEHFACGLQIKIQNGVYSFLGEKVSGGGTYVLDDAKWPHRVALTWIENDDPVFRRPGEPLVKKTRVILYDLNGDTLKLCLSFDSPETCPKQFNSKNKQGIYVLRREKK